MDTLPITPRTRLKRGHRKANYERETIYQILDEALVCHVGAVVNDHAMVQPTLHWRIDDTLYIHGSAKNGLFKALLNGQTACITITILDGLVFARSAFEHTVNHRSVMLYAQGTLIEEETEKRHILDALMERVMEGRSQTARPPNDTELKATSVLAFPIQEASAKIRTGMPDDKKEDLNLPVWAGIIPYQLVSGEAITDTPKR